MLPPFSAAGRGRDRLAAGRAPRRSSRSSARAAAPDSRARLTGSAQAGRCRRLPVDPPGRPVARRQVADALGIDDVAGERRRGSSRCARIGVMRMISTLSASPGSAPSTKIGPFIGLGPDACLAPSLVISRGIERPGNDGVAIGNVQCRRKRTDNVVVRRCSKTMGGHESSPDSVFDNRASLSRNKSLPISKRRHPAATPLDVRRLERISANGSVR